MTMAKARGKRSDLLPKLVFRENGSASNDGAVIFKENDVDLDYVSVSKSQSFKTVFLGDSNVGKTCLAKLFVEGVVVDQSTNTIGFDHHVKELQVSEQATVKLQIWDTAGMEQFRNALITKYYRNADGIVLVYDISRRESFENLEMWIKEVQQYCDGGLERIRMVLIGNKLDLKNQRQVEQEEVQRLIQRYRITEWVELSAKTSDHLPKLESLFTTLAREMTSVRESIELTKSAKLLRKNVITLDDDWEVITAPESPVPHYAYRDQDSHAGRRKKTCSRC